MSEALFGIIPPMTTPFDAAGELDEAAIRAQVRWLLDAGVHGLAAGGSTGEGHALDQDELRRLVATVTDEAAGRVPVIAGIIVDSTRDAIRRGKAVADLGVAALQVTPVHYLFRPDDAAMLEHFRAIAEATGLPIVIYNVVPWSYLSPQLLVRIMREVPGVIGVKQSAGDLKLFADLMLMAPSRRKNLQRGRRAALPVLRARRPWHDRGAAGGGASCLRAALGCGAGGRPCPCARPAPAPARALERAGRRQPARLHQICAVAARACRSGQPRAPMPPASAAQQQAIQAALRGLV